MTPRQFKAARGKVAHIEWRIRFALSRGIGERITPAAELDVLIGELNAVTDMLGAYRDSVAVLENARTNFKVDANER